MTPHRPTRPAPTAVAVPAWDRFVERSGVPVTIALLVVILAATAAQLRPTPVAHALAGPQLLLELIVLGCIGVLAYRRGDA